MECKIEEFAKTYYDKDGEQIWEFLNLPDNIVRMETASYLSRPSAEPLSPGLLKNFGDLVHENTVKQMIGKMIKQIMEYNGYIIDKRNVNIRTEKNIFKTATRYKIKK